MTTTTTAPTATVTTRIMAKADKLVDHQLSGICKRINCDELLAHSIRGFWVQVCTVDLDRIHPKLRWLFRRHLVRGDMQKILMKIRNGGFALYRNMNLPESQCIALFTAAHILLEEFYGIRCNLDPDNQNYDRTGSLAFYDRSNPEMPTLRALCIKCKNLLDSDPPVADITDDDGEFTIPQHSVGLSQEPSRPYRPPYRPPHHPDRVV